MSKNIDRNLGEIYQINILQQRNQWVNKLHPLVKLLLSIFFIIFVVSLDKYSLAKVISFALYPFIIYNLADIRVSDALKRLKIVLPIVLLVGIFNPFFDKSQMFEVGTFTITGGMVSMVTLMLKGFYAVLSAYALIATTSIEDICYALRCIKIPKIVVTVVLLIYRYLFILAEEGSRISAAYSLRAPRQKGFAYKTWGPLVGQWLLRSMDKAERVYESMKLRGFNGEFRFSSNRKATMKDFMFFVVWMVVFVILRYTSVIYMLGDIFVTR